MCLHLLPLPKIPSFKHAQASLLLDILHMCRKVSCSLSVFSYEHIISSQAGGLLFFSREGEEMKWTLGGEMKWQPCCLIKGNDGTLASVLKMICRSCDEVVNEFFPCPLVHRVDKVDCNLRLKVLRLAAVSQDLGIANHRIHFLNTSSLLRPNLRKE